MNNPEDTCEWFDDDGGRWETGCDQAFEFNMGGPKDNDFKFCPYCGKKIVVKLHSEINEPDVMRDVLVAVRQSDELSGHAVSDRNVHFEHGHWWVSCHKCGASWSVIDIGDAYTGEHSFGFEQVSEGDGWCAEQEQEQTDESS